MKSLSPILLLLGTVAALAQAVPAPRVIANSPVPVPPAAPVEAAPTAAPPPVSPQGGTALVMRGLDKITGRPTSITAQIGKPVQFATLTITAR
ncbi:MAG TPA: hypothetical protein VLL04_08015, partial [Rhizomicrobium sp.]|nr:hypothetical protein [Rhizomicrobium sp.]